METLRREESREEDVMINMKRLVPLPFIVTLLLVSACTTQNRSILEIEMYNPEGDSLGTAKFTEQPDGVQVKVSVTGLEPGFHGIHVHEFPKCEGPDFKSAGNHFNPDSKLHGLMHPEGSHAGDLPNLEAGGDGKVDVELMLSGATLKDGKGSLLKGEGTSLIIHEAQDDGVSQPAGDAGARIACGKITLEEANQKETSSDPTESGDQKSE